MTLKITRFLTDIMNKQAVISHFDSKIMVGKPYKLNDFIKTKISEIFGKLFLADANYVVLTKIPSINIEKSIKKFADLASNVFETTVLKSDIKSFQLNDDEDEDEISQTILFLKITTK